MSAPQDTTLEVEVFGSDFDDGSTVEFLLDEEPTDGIVTNSTRFVNPKKLVADISIRVDADPDLYDVAVTTSKGKRGIGIELFEVTCSEWDPGRDPPNGCLALSGGYETPTTSPLPASWSTKTKGRNAMITFLESQKGPIEITVPDLTEATAAVLCRTSANTPGFDEGSASDIVAFWNGDGEFAYPRGAVLRNFFAKVDLNANGAPHEEHRSHGVHVDADEIRWNYRVGTSLTDLETGEALWPGVLSTGTWNGNQESPVVTISGGVISLWRRDTDTGEQIRVSCLNQEALEVDFVIDRCEDDDSCGWREKKARNSFTPRTIPHEFRFIKREERELTTRLSSLAAGLANGQERT